MPNGGALEHRRCRLSAPDGFVLGGTRGACGPISPRIATHKPLSRAVRGNRAALLSSAVKRLTHLPD